MHKIIIIYLVYSQRMISTENYIKEYKRIIYTKFIVVKILNLPFMDDCEYIIIIINIIIVRVSIT